MTSAEEHIRKANQHWEMAGLARRDGDSYDAITHTRKAQEHERLAREKAS